MFNRTGRPPAHHRHDRLLSHIPLKLSAMNLISELKIPCPQCGTPTYQGIRGRGMLIAHCPMHGIWVTSRNGWRADAGHGHMHCEERLWLLERSLSRFLVDPDVEDFMAIQSSTLPCNQVLVRFGDGRFWLEVDSREWGCPTCGDQPLTAAALRDIGELGFCRRGGGPNPELVDPPLDPRAIAVVADEAMLRAYGERADYELGVYFKRTAVMADVVADANVGL